MKKFKIIYCLALMMVFSACSDDHEENIAPVLDDVVINDQLKSQFRSLNFDPTDIAVTNFDDALEPAYENGNYLLEGDISVPARDFSEMLKSAITHTGAVGEQYRHTTLVSGLPRTIRVIGYTGGSAALDPTMKTALQWAINNYNALNIGLYFTLTFGTNYSPYDIVVYKVSGGGGGSAGFPSGGNPYKYVRIQSGTSAYGYNVTEHVMTHEIGHCLGLRHTDWFNRSLSCGTGGSESPAIWIPGTPAGFDPNSVMLACFNSGESGEFGYYDKKALEYLY